MDETTANLVAAMKAWRAAHPTATFTEIESELEGALSKVRAEMLSDLASASAAAEGETVAGERVRCPVCGGRTQRSGYRTRKLRAPHDQEVEMRRRYMKCAQCGHTFSPSGQ